ncbi:hypothetical protein HO133_004058 [Letharia lupina]|uniref:FAS1 domain-containing protein n=1 Tax=Letharia lupina TaxID=560253 RepID=A0A8H6F9I0_9LECA|nr:uncharacterized protein HO133_004058 [Letharia lupina]KAF6219589.1 hypothetical protein HO133_004058 [Letharia lupina]
MKLIQILPLAALSTAFVIPEEQVMSQVAIESDRAPDSFLEKIPSKDEAIKQFHNSFTKLIDTSKNAFDDAIEYATETTEEVSDKAYETAYHVSSWLDSATDRIQELGEEVVLFSEDDEEHHGGKGRKGRKGHHGHCKKPNLTVYELISKSKYTTKLAALIDEYEDVIELLNGTASNYTVFAPTDKAFEKIPEHAPKPSKEELKKILLYHVSEDFYPAGKVLVTHTVPTLLSVDTLGIGPQRLATEIGLKGLTVNFYSRIVAIDIFGTNGVIHGVDSLLIPPPKIASIIQFLPGEFSTLELGLTKTGLLPAIADTSNHIGGTIFAPSNFAFQKLGPKINGFLFSKYGQKYLKALLEYHVVANQTLYSDAYYKSESVDNSVEKDGIPKGFFHIDLKTLLDDKSLSVDVARYGRYIEIKINAFSTVTIEDGIASDGVIHVVSNVLVPPKAVDRGVQHWDGGEMTVEELKERLEPLMGNEKPQEL